jgi:hypothetical protein
VEKTSLSIELEQDGQCYKGWATPSDKRHADGYAKSYHVVLNEIFFGDLNLDKGKWSTSDQRPQRLVKAVGKAIEKAEATRSMLT